MNIQDKIDEIASESVPSPSQIPFSLLSRPDLKTSQLWIDSPEKVELKSSSKFYEFQFKSPILIVAAAIRVEGYSSYDEFEVRWTTLNGARIVQTATPKEDVVSFEPNEIIIDFSFRPPSKLLPGKKIVSVTAEGLDYEALATTLKAHQRISSWKQNVLSEVKTLQTELSEKSNKISALNEQIEDSKGSLQETENNLRIAQQELAKSEAQQEQARQDLAKREETLSKANDEFQDIKRKTSIEQNNRRDLVTEISEKQIELKRLKADIDLFPAELEGFTKQGAKNSRTYVILSLIPILVIVVLTANLIFGAGTLKEAAWGKPFSEVLAAILSRGPYVTLCTIVIVTCYYIAHFLLSEVIKINRQRLSLNKILIIAQDISKSSAYELDEISDEEMFEKRVQFKMTLLRDHLKTYISEDLIVNLPTIKKIKDKIFDMSEDNNKI